MRVGIVGAGAIARIHATKWLKLPVSFAGCFDRQPIERTGRQKYGFGDAHGTLVGNEFLVRSFGIVRVLVNVYDRFGGNSGITPERFE